MKVEVELTPVSGRYMTPLFGITAPNIDTILIDGKITLSYVSVEWVNERYHVKNATEVRTKI